MKLYDMGLAPNARRVRWFLAEKGISIESQQIDLATGENIRPEFLAINPRGLVPTLVLDDGTVIDESVAICRYFEELQPEPNLMGRDALEKAMIECWQRRMEFDGFNAVGLAFRNSAPHLKGRAMPGAAPASEQMPELVERGIQLTRHFFDVLDKRLGESAFVAGDRFTIADITGYIAVSFARWIKQKPGEHHQNVVRWQAMLAERPASKA